MGLLALELVALLVLFAADDAVNDRASAASWSATYEVLVAVSIAMVLATALQLLARAGMV
jgi:hypothetical protein